jgi:hypothetical protein
VIFDESVEFFLAEKFRRKDHVLTKEEAEEKKRYTYSFVRRWDYDPTGELMLGFGPYMTTDFRKKWAEGTKKRLEDMLDAFVIEAVKIAAERQRERRKREEEHRRWMEEQRVLEEETRRQEMEQQRCLELESQADQWAKAERIREYVKAVERETSSRGEHESSRERPEEWASWARQHADSVDPVKK